MILLDYKLFFSKKRTVSQVTKVTSETVLLYYLRRIGEMEMEASGSILRTSDFTLAVSIR